MPNASVISTKPDPDPVRSYRFPEVHHHTTTNGIQVKVAPVTRVPLVTLHYLIDGGAIYEETAAAGVAMLTARALAEGTATLSGDDVADRFELLGSAMEPDAGWEAIEARNTVVSSNMKQTTSLVADLLTAPAFRDDDLSRLRDERIAELIQRDTEPRGLADDVFARTLYGKNTRLQLPVGGERETVQPFSSATASDWHSRVFRPERLAVLISGDVDADDAFTTIEDTLGHWQASDAAPVGPTPAPTRDRPATHFLPKVEAAQSELRVGHLGPPRGHTDYYAITVLNAILGGLFGSRLNLNLRERHGYTYGAFSSFQWRRDGSTFHVSTAVRTDVTVRALMEIRDEISRIRNDAITADELAAAVEHLQGVFPIRFETTAALANALAAQHIFGLPSDYFDVYRDRIGAVTVADVLRVAQQHLKPDDLNITIVGNVSLQDELTELAHGELVVLDDPALGKST